jgi:inorganic pyrophosphatase/exopolyphosphatase
MKNIMHGKHGWLQVGSCCTLVAKAFEERYPQALASPTLRRLLKAGILLDSGFLDRSKGRTTDLDEEMAELLGGRGEVSNRPKNLLISPKYYALLHSLVAG